MKKFYLTVLDFIQTEGYRVRSGVKFLEFYFFHKSKVFTVTFQTKKKIIQKEQIVAEKLGKGVWVRCLFSEFFFQALFSQVYFCL